MAPKSQKHPWRDLNYIKRKKKKLKTEAKLLKKFKEEKRAAESSEPSEVIAETTLEFTKNQEPSTISLAVPGSIMDLCQNTEIKCHRALQIARAACIYRVDEVSISEKLFRFYISFFVKMSNDAFFDR